MCTTRERCAVHQTHISIIYKQHLTRAHYFVIFCLFDVESHEVEIQANTANDSTRRKKLRRASRRERRTWKNGSDQMWVVWKYSLRFQMSLHCSLSCSSFCITLHRALPRKVILWSHWNISKSSANGNKTFFRNRISTFLSALFLLWWCKLQCKNVQRGLACVKEERSWGFMTANCVKNDF